MSIVNQAMVQIFWTEKHAHFILKQRHKNVLRACAADCIERFDLRVNNKWYRFDEYVQDKMYSGLRMYRDVKCVLHGLEHAINCMQPLQLVEQANQKLNPNSKRRWVVNQNAHMLQFHVLRLAASFPKEKQSWLIVACSCCDSQNHCLCFRQWKLRKRCLLVRKFQLKWPSACSRSSVPWQANDSES